MMAPDQNPVLGETSWSCGSARSYKYKTTVSEEPLSAGWKYFCEFVRVAWPPQGRSRRGTKKRPTGEAVGLVLILFRLVQPG
jgi:hypothetical protein